MRSDFSVTLRIKSSKGTVSSNEKEGKGIHVHLGMLRPFFFLIIGMRFSY